MHEIIFVPNIKWTLACLMLPTNLRPKNTISQHLACPVMGHLLNQSIYLALLRAVFFLSVFLSSGYFLSLLEAVDEDGVWNLPFIVLFSSILAHQIV